MNQNDQIDHFVPQRLDDPEKFGLVDMEVAFAFIVPVLVMTYFDRVWWGLGAGILLGWGVQKLKAGAHPGWIYHLVYWYVGALRLKSLPPSHLRELIG